MAVDLVYLLLDDGSKFLYNPATEARPTSVDGKRIVGTEAGPSIQSEDEDYEGPKTRALVNAALTEARAPAAVPALANAGPEPPHPAQGYDPEYTAWLERRNHIGDPAAEDGGA